VVKPLLVGEVVVEEGGVDPRGAGDGLDGGGLEAPPGEEQFGGVENAGAGVWRGPGAPQTSLAATSGRISCPPSNRMTSTKTPPARKPAACASTADTGAHSSCSPTT
jgi:hypothetical protein